MNEWLLCLPSMESGELVYVIVQNSISSASHHHRHQVKFRYCLGSVYFRLSFRGKNIALSLSTFEISVATVEIDIIIRLHCLACLSSGRRRLIVNTVRYKLLFTSRNPTSLFFEKQKFMKIFKTSLFSEFSRKTFCMRKHFRFCERKKFFIQNISNA